MDASGFETVVTSDEDEVFVGDRFDPDEAWERNLDSVLEGLR